MRKLLVIGTTIALTAVMNAPAAAAANDLVCTGAVSSGTYGDVTVPAGNSCQLGEGVVVQGNFVATGAVDVVVSGVTIEGNVRIEQSTGSDVILNSGTTVGGNVEVADNTVDTVFVGSAISGGVTIDGNVEITGNTAEIVVANASTFGRNVSITHNTTTEFVQVFCNVFTGGNVDVSSNIATGELGYVEVLSDCTVFGLPLGGQVNGNITMTENIATYYVALAASYTPKNVEFSHNTAESTFVGGLSVGRNLTCTGNTPAPSTFDVVTEQDYPNTVSGKDRCNA